MTMIIMLLSVIRWLSCSFHCPKCYVSVLFIQPAALFQVQLHFFLLNKLSFVSFPGFLIIEPVQDLPGLGHIQYPLLLAVPVSVNVDCGRIHIAQVDLSAPFFRN